MTARTVPLERHDVPRRIGEPVVPPDAAQHRLALERWMPYCSRTRFGDQPVTADGKCALAQLTARLEPMMDETAVSMTWNTVG